MRIDPGARERLLAHGRETLPEEACGLLLGDAERVLELAPARNAAEGDRRTHFEIDPRDFVEADSLARALGLEIVGSYHSHPGRRAVPSDADRAAAESSWLLVIVGQPGMPAEELRAWRRREGDLLEETLTEG